MRLLAYLVLAAGLISAADSPLQVFNRAISALSAGNYAEAERGFREVLQSVPDHPGALLNLGVVYSRMERYDEAIAQYRELLRLNPRDKSALANLAVACVKKGSYSEAMPVFQQLAQVNRDSAALHDPDLLYRFASGFLRQNRAPEDRRSLEALLSGTAGAAVLCKVDFDAGRFDEAANECRAAGAQRDLGKVLVSQHSPDAAAELALAIRQHPKDAEAQYYMGVALLQDNRTADAIPYLERAIQWNEKFWGAYFYLGRARLELAQYADAAPLLRKAAELNPRAAVVFYELGRALMAAGQPAEAKLAMQRVRELRAQELEADAQALRKQAPKQ